MYSFGGWYSNSTILTLPREGLADMNTKNLDVVYIVKERETNEELRYSLRSVAKNLPHATVWIVGYCPRWVARVSHIRIRQSLPGKHLNSMNNWNAATLDERITPNYVHMNDDFFVMQPIEKLEHYHMGDFAEFAKAYHTSYPDSQYTQVIARTNGVLESLRASDAKCYELHVPMVMNRVHYQEAMQRQREFNPTYQPVFPRSLVGSLNNYGGTKTNDVKVYDLDGKFDKGSLFLSTTDKTFKHGKVGQHIRSVFAERCKYEK